MSTITSAPTLDQLVSRGESDFSLKNPDIDPKIERSWAKTFVYGQATRAFDLYKTQQQYVDQLFPQTAIYKYLKRWGSYDDVLPLSSSNSSGDILITGVLGTSIPALAQYTYDSIVVETEIDASISELMSSLTITTIGTTATAVSETEHGYATGTSPAISSATYPDYDGDYEIVVFDDFTFTFEVASDYPASITDGASILYAATVGVNSVLSGADQNIPSNAELSSVATIDDTDNVAYAFDSGISGGSDIESNDDYRTRVLFNRANPFNQWNPAQISRTCLEIAGVTRVYPQPITPRVGQTTVYFFRDNDEDPIPDANEVETVRNALLEYYPAYNSEDNLFVNDPDINPTYVDFNFSSIFPDTTSMRNAVTANLGQFFEEQVEFEQTITEDSYKAAISNTIDDTGASLESFTLSDPSGDIVNGSAGIAFLGEVNYD